MLSACNLPSGIQPLRLIDPAWQLSPNNALETLSFQPLIATRQLLGAFRQGSA